MAGSLSVSITADVADIRAKLALAQADLRAFNSETRSLADQMRAAGDAGASSLGAGLQAAAQKAAQAKAEVTALNSELKANAAAGASSGVSAMTQGFQNLGNVIATARTAITGFLAAAGVERFAGAISGALKLGEEMEILAAKTRIPVTALSDLKYAADQQNVSFEVLQQALRGLAVTTEEAIVKPTSRAAAGYAQLGISTEFLRANQNNLMAILTRVADAYATGGTAAQQADNAQIIFLRGGRELIPVLQLGAAGLDAAAERARAFGNELSPGMATKLAEAEKKIKDANAAWEGMKNVLAVDLSPAIATTALELADLFAGTNESKIILYEQYLKNNIERLKEAQDAATAAQGEFAKLWYEGEIVRYGADIDAIRAKLTALRLENQPNLAKGGIVPLPGPSVDVSSLPGGGPGAKPGVPMANPWKDLADRSTQATALEKFREGLAEMEASWNGTHVAMLQEAVNMWASEVNSAKLNAKEKVEAEKGYADAVRALRQAQRAETEAIAKSDGDTNIAISKLQISAEKDILAAQFQAHQINADQRRALLQNLVDQEYQINLAELQRELGLLENQPAEWERVYNQIKLLKAQNVQDLAALDRQYTADVKRENEEQVASWKSAVSEIDSAEGSLVSDILTKRQSMTTTLAQITDRMIASEITADLRYYTNKLLYNALGLADDQKSATGGILAHLFEENSKNAATATGAATRRDIGATEDSSFLTRIPQMIGRWLGLETSKTAATTAGATQREAVFTAEQLAGQAASVAAGFSQIEIDAAVAAAGAFAATAQIPYIGPELAPEAAAAAYAATIGWAAGLGGGIAGLDVGAWSVRQGGLAYVHTGETVTPAVPGPNFNQGMAAALAGGGGEGDIHIHGPLVQAIDTQTGAKFLLNNMQTIARGIAREIRNANGHLSAAARA